MDLIEAAIIHLITVGKSEYTHTDARMWEDLGGHPMEDRSSNESKRREDEGIK